MTGPSGIHRSLYGQNATYTYDFDRRVFVCSCGFEISDEAVIAGTRKTLDEVTVHAIAHRLIDE